MKNMEEKQVRGPHKLVINNRQTSLVTGVLDVLSFDLNEVLLETEQGMLMVKGMDLHVNRLNLEKGRGILTVWRIRRLAAEGKMKSLCLVSCSVRWSGCRSLEPN